MQSTTQPATLDSPPPAAQHRQTRSLGLIILLLVLFCGLAFFARTPWLLHYDTAITREVQEGHTDVRDYIAFFITTLGNGLFMTLLCIGAAAVLKRAGRPRAALFSLLTLLGLPLNMLLKLIVHRPRPAASLVRILFPEPGDSFPSGHAMGSVIVYGFLAYLAWTYIKDLPRRRFWTTVLALTPIGISFTRIYIGVHWFSDIIGAWIFGLLVLLIFADLYHIAGAQERAAHLKAIAERNEAAALHTA
jgi:membrane-associated phospholipid phosphatase